jgi:hypothetical protein
MEAAIRRRKRNEHGDSSSDDVSVRGEPGSLEDRRLTAEEWDRRVEIIEQHGLPVRLTLDPLPEDPEVYEPDAQEWVEDDHHETGGYYRDKKVLLRIRLIPVHDLGKGFQKLADRPRRRGEDPYHIGLCFTNELHRFDVYDRRNGVRKGQAAYMALRAKYNDRLAILKGKMQRTTLVLNGRTHVHHHPANANIYRDADVRALHDCGEYHDRSLHASL